MKCTAYASLYPEEALLPDSVAEKKARHRKLGRVGVQVQEDGAITVDPRPFMARLREGEELTFRFS